MNIKDLKIDELSLKILAVLQENSRMSFSEVGRIVGLSSPAVAERVKKMENSGVIKRFSVEISHEQLGLDMPTFTSINLPGIFGREMAKILEELKEHPEILECHRITGTNDVLVKSVLTSRNHLRQLLDILAKFGPVSTSISVESYIDKPAVDLKELINSNTNKDKN